MPRPKLPEGKRPYHTSVYLLPEHRALLRSVGAQQRRSTSYLVRDALEDYFRKLGMASVELGAKAS